MNIRFNITTEGKGQTQPSQIQPSMKQPSNKTVPMNKDKAYNDRNRTCATNEVNITLLREKVELENYFEELSDFIYTTFESTEDQAVLENFIDSILEEEGLSIDEKLEAINDGINRVLNQEFLTKKKKKKKSFNFGGAAAGEKFGSNLAERVRGTSKRW